MGSCRKCGKASSFTMHRQTSTQPGIRSPTTLLGEQSATTTTARRLMSMRVACGRAGGRSWERGQHAPVSEPVLRGACFSRLRRADTDSETTTSTSSSGGWCVVFRRRRAPRHGDRRPAKPMLPSLSLVFYATSLVVFAMTYLQPAQRKYSRY